MASRSRIRNALADNPDFMRILRATASAISCAGVATLQARQLLITQTASPLGEAAVVQATSGLATAYSLGSVAEFFLSPVFGKMSDRFGRKPILLFFMIGPAIMRTLCALVEQPVARIRLLWLDFASARAIGIQPFIGMCQTMITDVYPVDKQPRARAQLGASQAFGNILGNYLSGWWNARAGPRSTYLCTAVAPLLSLAFASACLPETNRDVKDCKASGEPGSVPTSPKTPTARGGKKSAYTTLLLDPECCLLAGVLGMYEFLNYAPLNSVAILFMKERLNWGPLEAGRFASGHALAGFCGSMLAGELIQFFGKRLYVSVTNLLTGVAYATWAVSKTGPSLIACLLPLSFGTGGNTVLLTRFVERAVQLGLSRGEAMGVMSAIGAVGRMIAPQLFTRLWLRAAAQKGQPRALPLGAPMFAVALITVIQELLYRSSLLFRDRHDRSRSEDR
ncbi:tetA [Symbiodinium sp. CCMP2456]|nr:tetA [Symbiodinium sp. CCMP2456]